MDNFEKRIVLVTGGTGGHIFPAQALAHQLSSQGYKVFIFSDKRGHEFKDSSVPTIQISAGQIHGSIVKKLRGGFTLLIGMGMALYHLRRIRPHAVIGFGGYASFPTMIAASTLGLPTIIHQADAYFGRTNRLLASFMTKIATSFPQVEKIPASCTKKVHFTGLPLRSDIRPATYTPSLENDPFHLLVTGGSQGAKVFGELIPQAVQLLDPSLQSRLYITQQCRIESLNFTKALYAQTQAHVELAPFLDQMGKRYANAHLVISRAGASSVLETALVGRPAIFIPYPYAMDNHQLYNAQQAVGAEGGWLMEEKNLSPSTLAAFLSELITSHWKLTQAATNIRTIANADASVRLANFITLTTD